jgi:hypothetical protein
MLCFCFFRSEVFWSFIIVRWVAGWLGMWVGGWVGGWVSEWVGGWLAGRLGTWVGGWGVGMGRGGGYRSFWAQAGIRQRSFWKDNQGSSKIIWAAFWDHHGQLSRQSKSFKWPSGFPEKRVSSTLQ